MLGEAGVRHGKVEVYDEEAGARLAPGFRELGWQVQCDVLMVARRAPDRPRRSLARPRRSRRRARARLGGSGHATTATIDDEDIVRQLAASKRIVLASEIDDASSQRASTARSRGYCELYSLANTGQIEAVLTLQRLRNRGLARALVLRALAASRAAGNDLTFLLARQRRLAEGALPRSSDSTRSAGSTSSSSPHPSSDRRDSLIA